MGGGGGGSNGIFQKRRLHIMFNLNLCVTLKKLNIITDHEKSIKGHMQREKIFSKFDFIWKIYVNKQPNRKNSDYKYFKTTFENGHIRSVLYGLSAPYNIAGDVTDEPVLAITM